MKRFLGFVMAVTLAAAMSLVFAEATTYSGVGTVRSLDRTKGQVTLTHGQITGLNWPGMTMDFKVRESRLFDRLQAGKQVAFEFVADSNRYVVISAIPLADQAAATEPSEQHTQHHDMPMMMGSGAMQPMMDSCMAMMKH